MILVVLAVAGAVLGVAQPVEGAAERRPEGGALLGRGGLEQVVARAPGGGWGLLVEPRAPGGRAGPPVLYGTLLVAMVLVGAVRLQQVVRPGPRRVLDRAPAALGSRGPPVSQRTD